MGDGISMDDEQLTISMVQSWGICEGGILFNTSQWLDNNAERINEKSIYLVIYIFNYLQVCPSKLCALLSSFLTWHWWCKTYYTKLPVTFFFPTHSLWSLVKTRYPTAYIAQLHWENLRPSHNRTN